MRTLIAELSFRFIYVCNMSRGEGLSREFSRLDVCSRCAEKREAEGWAVEVTGEAEGVDTCHLCGYLTPEGALRERQAHDRALRGLLTSRVGRDGKLVPTTHDGRSFDEIMEAHMQEVRERGGNP